MKKLSTLLIAVIAIVSVNAQNNSDIAAQSASVSNYKPSSLFADKPTPSSTQNDVHGTAKKDIKIMPDAATKNIKIIYKATAAATATIVVTDENGKKVLTQATEIAAGNNNIEVVDFSSLNEGTYTIDLISNNETHTSSFMIWK